MRNSTPHLVKTASPQEDGLFQSACQLQAYSKLKDKLDRCWQSAAACLPAFSHVL
jgi:hypothetical protein